MDTLKQLRDELSQEYKITRKFIDNFPEGKNDYAPHEKSMKLMPLATHVVEIFGWPDMIFKTDVLDFSVGDYKPTVLNSREDLLKVLDDSYNKGIAAIDEATEDMLDNKWALANAGHKLAEWSKYGSVRHALNQVTHHRAQLGVYYRMLGIDVPSSYGPSADDQNF